MTEHPGLPPDHRKAERTIVLQLLRDDHDGHWSRSELQVVLDDIEPSLFVQALERLHQHGVVRASPNAVLASPCARRLDLLELIGM